MNNLRRRVGVGAKAGASGLVAGAFSGSSALRSGSSGSALAATCPRWSLTLPMWLRSRLIAKGSRNRWLENLLVKDVYSLLRLYRVQAARRPDVTDSMAEHHAIINRIHARDGEGAEAAMRLHLRGSRARMLAAASG